ncbi:hypothetical protein T440DRAFT_471303 [Plenodomus tracheiphilus IPT5]|uniref:SnoaL-like domain-containing protein n=1 Tax=Plenodomus tracheiphilus IPT5 TaxID=1408161 RepID=A0A6A7AVX4_9PLEO|nr:hypothetical protein T440DRAFT_471303 [Plenodomus tracheiphilus IPT5]
MASAPSSTTLRTRIETTARAFLSAFEESGTQNNPSIINRGVTADCTRHLLPASVPKAFGLPTDFAFDNATYLGAFTKDLKVLKFKNNVISNLVIDTEARRASFTSNAEVHVNGGESYSGEQAWFLYVNEDGSKVEKVVEFCDKDLLLKMASASA